ncbi:hypothetical protein CVD25_09625 [Bacillus canaveralius]|uniref:Lipoprotein n=1 Tax=Bacillus canaveralius TaxID=1403243 RepID=A0A2N5GGJ2_9BACI|nr:hypothetical protein [Bacillus canaveralius]PLR79851.1 hypothetical protein CU635_20945 [Bacillus canaveralius]PLR97800.1 hypothetical protein CVD25_09625 [Bacillus canaveralius]RSK45561.1 hypothetical protein EJA13_19225 [Bacillus canaveralius]
MASESGKQLFRKKWSVLLIALTIIGSIVSGCGNNNNEDTEAKKDLVKAEKKIEELEKQLEEVKGELVLAQAPKEETVDEAATGTTTHEPAPAPAPAPAATPATTAFENPIAQLDPAVVASEINKKAEADWVDDYEMQDYQVENQTAAYNELKAMVIDTDVKQTQIERAMQDWGMDFEMVQYQYENQMEAYNN